MGLAARPDDQAQLAMFPGVLCKGRWRGSLQSDELTGLNFPASPAAGVSMEGPGSSRGRGSQGVRGVDGAWPPGQEADSRGNVSSQPYGWGN